MHQPEPDDEWEDDLDDPDDADQDGGDGPELMECPYCGEEIVEDAELCPHCRSYISREDAPAARRPLWITVGVIVTLVLILVVWATRGW